MPVALLPVWTAWAALSACVPRMVLSVPLLFALTGTVVKIARSHSGKRAAKK